MIHQRIKLTGLRACIGWVKTFDICAQEDFETAAVVWTPVSETHGPSLIGETLRFSHVCIIALAAHMFAPLISDLSSVCELTLNFHHAHYRLE